MNKAAMQPRIYLRVAMSFLLMILGLQNGLTSGIADSQQVKQAQEAISMIARGVLDPNSIILIGETRLDIRARYFNPEEMLKISPFWTTLSLNPVAPISIIRGKNVDKGLIWVQQDSNRLIKRDRFFYHLPKLSDEGVWIFILKPVRTLPQAMSKIVSKPLSVEIFSVDRSMPPIELAKKFGFQNWFNERTWFELAYEFSAFRIEGRAVRDLPLPTTGSKIYWDQIVAGNDRIRKVQLQARQRQSVSPEFVVNEIQFGEIEGLVKLFQDPSHPPSVEQLLALKSEFSEAVLRELAKTATPDLDSGLRKLKESIPKGVLEDIFKSE